MSVKIAIIGAGLAGLSCAYRLEQQDFQGTIDIFEKKPEVGGSNIFLEFVSELFHRPIEDFFSHIAKEYNLYLVPQHTIYRTQTIGPRTSSCYQGFMGHVVVRGKLENSLEKQLARQLQTPITCGYAADPGHMKSDYDVVVIATGRLQDVPSEIGVRIDRYVHFYHGLLKGSFDVKLSKLWLNDTYALKGNAFQLTLDEQTSMIALATPIREFELAKAWDLFIKNEFGKEVELTQLHEIKDFAIGQPKKHIFKNQILVGNVAGGVQPALGFGLHTAILSGIYAADSILCKANYEHLMGKHSKEFMWSLALRNALEQLGNHEYDLLVQGLHTAFGRAVLRKGGFNFNRYLGKLLAAFTNETKKSQHSNMLFPYEGRDLIGDSSDLYR